MKQLALIAPTASGKTELSIKLAKELNANILSLDSLSIYKEIDIASAKPTIDERGDIVHFGVDIIYPNEDFSVVEFIKEYQKAKSESIKSSKNLIIVGGSSFYLKTLLDGVSDYSNTASTQIKDKLNSFATKDAYIELLSIDKKYAESIKANDRYRVLKGLEIFYMSDLTPTQFFLKYPQKPIIENLDIYEIDTSRDILRDRIDRRTQKMIERGLIDEVAYLEKKYGRNPNSMKSIGVKESLEYLDGKISKKSLQELISTHTAQLAKRQKTFNKSQFQNVISLKIEQLFDRIVENF
jgi:tRNA dimethylallyltransferase